MKRLIALSAASLWLLRSFAGDTPPPVIHGFSVSNNVKTFQFTPAPAIQQYQIKSGSNLSAPLTNDNSGGVSNFTYRTTNATGMNFYSVAATPMSSNDLLSVNLLNRIAYGPTPDELARVKAIGPQAYIAEQLAPENIVDTYDSYVTHVTNGISAPEVPTWRFLSYTGFFSSSNLYLYLTAPGAEYIDDISLVPLTNFPVSTNYTTNINGSVTNVVTNVVTSFAASTNVLFNGDFESGAIAPWTVGANAINSTVTNNPVYAGNYSLRLAAAVGASGAGHLQQNMTNLWFRYDNSSTRAVLSFWYLESPTSKNIKTRLSGSGVVASGNNEPPAPEWVYATATGLAEGNPTIYIYLSGSGEAYIDDMQLVSGTVAGVGPNRLRNGDFETPLGSTNWNLTANFSNSVISTNFSRTGSGSLKVVATAAGAGNGNAIFQTNIFITNLQPYTVSFWYLPPTRSRTLTVRFSGADAGDATFQSYEPGSTPGNVRRLLDSIGTPSFVDGSVAVTSFGGAQLHDLRSYHVNSAVQSKRQLIEVLLQFLENHFVTQHGKSYDYLDRFYDDGTLIDKLATDWEYRERVRWQAALLNPNCTFYDLLKIHVESPAEIVYLDTVDSRGNGNNIANENYAREIMELFCMGVDNGYDQYDITVMSRAWTGWSVEIVDPENMDNPFAPQSQRIGFYPGVGSSSVSNLIGVWTFNYKMANHGTNRAPIWSEWDTNSPATNPRPIGSAAYPHAGGQSKVVPARFGPPWAGQPYRLVIPPGRTSTVTNGILDGYDITTHIANLPFTMEYISVKLCRLFVHDNFPNPNTLPGSAEGAFYDYTNPNRSAEAELVRQCMVAWNTPGLDGRKGNIRQVLNAIFSSDLFRSHGGSLQKVKTPVEFAVSAIRALQSTNTSGVPFARTDGYSISGRSRSASSSPLTRMGSMMLFDRDAPDGYPETAAPWISSGTLAERTRFIQTYLMAVGDANKNDGISGGNNNVSDPVGLLKAKLPSGSWSDPGAVADFFLGILFPSEGAGNLQDFRALAIDFLNTNDNGVGTSSFASLVNTTPAYDSRVRALVAALMSSPRFQEQ